MTHISVDDVKKLAHLSALSVSDNDVEKLRSELETILAYVEQLETVDTDNVLPTYQVTGLENVTRKDEIVDYGVAQIDLLKNAPDTVDGSIKVPRVIV